MKINNLIRYILLITGLILHNPLANSTVFGAGISGTGTTCAPGYDGVLTDYGISTGCGWAQASEGSNKAVILWGAGQEFRPSNGGAWTGVTYGFERGYVPFSGNFRVRMYFCPSTSKKICTQKMATQYLDSNANVFLNSTELVVNQNPNFAGYNGVLLNSSNHCIAYLDEEMNLWKSNGAFFCQDTLTLPDTGSTCYINHENSLDVNIGILERSEIQTNAESSNHHVEKEFTVLCTRDAGTTATVQFEYASLSLINGDAIKSTANGVGVIMKYNGEYVKLNKTFTKTYAPGYTYETLDFYAVRDSSTPVQDIPSGDFTASAVMILTIQ